MRPIQFTLIVLFVLGCACFPSEAQADHGRAGGCAAGPERRAGTMVKGIAERKPVRAVLGKTRFADGDGRLLLRAR